MTSPTHSGLLSTPNAPHMAPSTIRLLDSPVPTKKAKLDQRLTMVSRHTLALGLVILNRSTTPLVPDLPPTSPIPIPPWVGQPRRWDDHPVTPTPTRGIPPPGILTQALLADAVRQQLSTSPLVIPSWATTRSASYALPPQSHTCPCGAPLRTTIHLIFYCPRFQVAQFASGII